MKRTLLERIPQELPAEIARLCEGVRVYDSSCSPEARVYFVDKDDGYYIKKAKLETLKKETSGLTEEKLRVVSAFTAKNEAKYDKIKLEVQEKPAEEKAEEKSGKEGVR